MRFAFLRKYVYDMFEMFLGGGGGLERGTTNNKNVCISNRLKNHKGIVFVATIKYLIKLEK